MRERRKVAIVVGDLSLPSFLTLFEPLAGDYDPVVYTLEGDRMLAGGSGLKLRVFQNVCDMPGFMRGLEEEIADASLIIGLETSRLATFQSLRAARKFGVPIGVTVNEFLPYFYERFANIRAIQFDICTKADRFWPTSAAAADCLKLAGVNPSTIRNIVPAVDPRRFRFDLKGRQRFRNYVGLQPQDLVVIFQGELTDATRPLDLLEALAILKRQAVPRCTDLRILFAGDGALAKDLKYRAHDLGLGRQVLFLHQEVTPFAPDMYAASDIAVLPRMGRTEQHEPLPLWILEAAATGVLPVVASGSVGAELLGSTCIPMATDGGGALAGALAALLATNSDLEVRRQDTAQWATQRFQPNCAAEPMLEDIRRLLGSKGQRGETFFRIMAEARADLANGQPDAAALRTAEAALFDPTSDTQKADLCCLNGEIAYARGHFDQAMEHYGEGLSHNERHAGCLRGLGFVAWHGHSSEEALTFFRKALSVDDDDPETQLGMGLTYRRLGLNEEAVHWLERSSMAEGAPATARTALAQTCSQLASPERAITILERVVEALGEEQVLLVTLGQLYMTAGKVEKGSALLQKALGSAG